MPDYCTGAPDGPAKPCCKQHDEDYAAQVPRAVADARFYQCMSVRGLWFRAPIYYAAVRLFGWWWYYTKGAPGRNESLAIRIAWKILRGRSK